MDAYTTSHRLIQLIEQYSKTKYNTQPEATAYEAGILRSVITNLAVNNPSLIFSLTQEVTFFDKKIEGLTCNTLCNRK